MKAIYAIVLLFNVCAIAQTTENDSLRILLKQPHADTTMLMQQVRYCHSYLFRQPDSAIGFGRQIIERAQQQQYRRAESRALNVVGQALRLTGDLPGAIESHLLALQISRKDNDTEELANSLALIGVVYFQVNDFKQGALYLRQSLAVEQRTQTINILALSVMGDAYEKVNNLDSAVYFQQKAYSLLPGISKGHLHSLVTARMGTIEARLQNNNRAMYYYHQALDDANITGDLLNSARVQFRIAELYYQMQLPDSSMLYARRAYQISERVSHKLTLLSVSNLLVKLFQNGQHMDSALHYQQVAMAVNDSLFGPAKYQRLQFLALSEQHQRQQLLDAQRLSKERFQKIFGSLVLAFVLLIAVMLWRSNHYQKVTNRSLHQKNISIEEQKNLLQTTLAELEQAQAKILEKEKLAALYRQQLQVHQVRNKIAAELHDDIGSTLSSINLFSEVAKKHINKDSSQAVPMLEKIKSSSQEMMLAMNEIVWSIQSKNDEVKKLVEKIQSFAGQLLAANKILFRFDYPEQLAAVPLDMESRRNIYLICKEALNNIVRHSEATEVVMIIKLEEKNILVEIHDNGRGFDSRQSYTGNGLQNFYSRANQVNGQLRIDSGMGKGSHVYLQCPLPKLA